MARPRPRRITFPVFMLVGSLALTSCCLFVKLIPKPSREIHPPPPQLVGRWLATKSIEYGIHSQTHLIDEFQVNETGFARRIMYARPPYERHDRMLRFQISGDRFKLISPETGKIDFCGAWSIADGMLRLQFDQGDKLFFAEPIGVAAYDITFKFDGQ